MCKCNFRRAKKSKFNGMAPSRVFYLASGDLIKVIKDVKQKVRMTVQPLFAVLPLFLAELKKVIVTKQPFSKKE